MKKSVSGIQMVLLWPPTGDQRRPVLVTLLGHARWKYVGNQTRRLSLPVQARIEKGEGAGSSIVVPAGYEALARTVR